MYLNAALKPILIFVFVCFPQQGKKERHSSNSNPKTKKFRHRAQVCM